MDGNNVDSSKSFKPRVAQLTLDSPSIKFSVGLGSDEYSDSYLRCYLSIRTAMQADLQK